MKNVLAYLLVTGSLFLGGTSQAQKEKSVNYDSLVKSKNYIFKAQNITTQRGMNPPVLSGDYDVRVMPDSVISYLPFFGRAFVAPVDPTKGGIQFTSTDFSYAEKTKKNRWEITIQFNDQRDTRVFYLDIYDGGRAELRITNTNREGITFTGYIMPGRARDKKAF